MAKNAKGATALKSPPKTREQRSAEKQALALWALLGVGGSAFGGKLKPEIEKPERDALLSLGLITVEKRQKSFWLDVTDRGWDWAEQHLADALPDKTFGGALILRAWLTRLQGFMRARQIRLAEVLAPQTPPVEPGNGEPPYPQLRERIRAAYLEITGGFNQRALLRDIHARLSDIGRSTLDAALKRMQREQEASLYQLDNRAEITDADRIAAIDVGSEPRHILWIER
jgi:hypothetical protein